MSKARQLADLGNVYDDGALSNRNMVINGSMQIWQRAVSNTSIANGTYMCDRFKAAIASSLAAGVDYARETSDVPDGHTRALKVTTDASETISTDDRLRILHVIENRNVQHLRYGTSGAKKVTLSFWVKSSVASSNYTIELWNYNHSRNISQAYTINSANTWEHKTLTFDGDTANGFSNNNSSGLSIAWWLDGGTDYSGDGFKETWGAYDQDRRLKGTTGWLGASTREFYLTGVQLECSDTSTPFEYLNYNEELSRCQRYFMRYDGNIEVIGQQFATTNSDCIISLPTVMRASPSVTTEDKSGNTNKASIYQSGAYTNNVPTAVNSARSRDNLLLMRNTGALSPAGSVDDAVQVQFDDFQADAEL